MRAHRLPRSMAVVALGVALAVALVARPLEAQERDRRWDRDRGRDDVAARIDTTVALSRGGTVDLSNISGSIRVTGWDRDDVRVRASAESGPLRFDATATRVTLSSESTRGHAEEARYEVQVPTGTRLLVASTSGSMVVRGVRGEIEARNTSGSIEIDDAAERVVFESMSGSVRVSRVRGMLRGSTLSSSILLTDVTGDVDVETVSGDVALRDVRSRSVRAGSVSGRIEYDGTADPAGRYELSSHSGSVRLTLPEELHAYFRVETFSGAIETDFPITLQPGEQGIGFSHPKRFEFRFGDGGARITAASFSGDIIIRRREARGGREG